MERLGGFATEEGTRAYAERFQGDYGEGHFRYSNGLFFSSIGAGTYLGEPDECDDRRYEEALTEALCSGINVIDTAINYRCQRSERVIGGVLRRLSEAGRIRREEVIVGTKGGFLPFDGGYPEDPAAYFYRTYLASNLLSVDDIAENCHALKPEYLDTQLERSLANLGLETIDIYYLHNPETQLLRRERRSFDRQLLAAFDWAERQVDGGKIRQYGLATWNGVRVSPEGREFLPLEDILVMARQAGGKDHHFKIIQLPFNLAMPEAWVIGNQPYGGSLLPCLEVAQKLGLTVIGSASLLQSRLAGELPAFFRNAFPYYAKSSQCALQFARSAPGIVTALVGMKSKEHIRENLETAKVPPLSAEEMILMFQEQGGDNSSR